MAKPPPVVVVFCIIYIFVFVISHFGFDDRRLALIVSVPSHCFYFIFGNLGFFDVICWWTDNGRGCGTLEYPQTNCSSTVVDTGHATNKVKSFGITSVNFSIDV